MRHQLFRIAVVALLLGVTPARADPAADLAKLKAELPGELINDPTNLDWTVFGPGAAWHPRKGADLPGGGALEIVIPAKAATLFANGTNVALTRPVKLGQDTVISFYARTIKADTVDGNGVIGVRFQLNAAPYPGYGDQVLSIAHEWKLYEVAARADRDLPLGQGVVSLQLSGARQTVQIAQTIVQANAMSIVKHAAVVPCKVKTPALMPQLAGQGEMLTEINALNWELGGAGRMDRITACGVAGDNALRFTIPAAGKNVYDSAVTLPLNAAVKAGDHLLVAFIARTVKAETPAGTGLLTVRLQDNNPPYPGFADHTFDIGPTWKLIQLRTVAKADLAAGQGAVALHLAGAAQVIDLGRVYVLRQPAGVP